MIALADQGRSTALTSFTAIQNLYNTAGTTGSTGYSNNYHDITSGSNGGYSSSAGYDMVTGIGSPKADVLLSALNK